MFQPRRQTFFQTSSHISSMMLSFMVLFVALVSPVRAECNPSNAVVAIASVFATLAVVALILLVVYLIMRRKQRGALFNHKKTRKANGLSEDGVQDSTDGYVNNAFTDVQDISAAEQGHAHVEIKSSSPGHKKFPAKDNRNSNKKTWASLPPQGDTPLYRQGSCGSLDDNIMHPDPEIISVCLESQDIIGLGFNISGNFGEGILVSQVHNRGPAVESGQIKVGDKILSVAVSYENIVYEDALTILSYASPYPVKITLQKAASLRPRDSTHGKRDHAFGATTDNEQTTQLNHPLYRSQSMDALKRVSGVKETANPPFQPKRAQSEVKPETRKDAGQKKKADRNSKNIVQDVFDKIAGTISPSKASPSKNEIVVSDVMIHNSEVSDSGEVVMKSKESVQFSAPLSYQHTSQENTNESTSSTVDAEAVSDFAQLMDQMLDLEEVPPSSSHNDSEHVTTSASSQVSAAAYVSPKTPPPNKPERKNRKSSGVDVSSFPSFSDLPKSEIVETEIKDDIIVPVSAVMAHSMPPKSYDDEAEVEEEIIVPEMAKREINIGSEDIVLTPKEVTEEEDVKDIEGALSSLAEMKILDMKRRPSSVEGEPVEEDVIEASTAKQESAAPPSLPHLDQDTAEKEKEQKDEPQKPALDEEMLERLIAMNAYAPGTQGWAGIQAGGNQGGVVDDFIPNSRTFMAQPIPIQDSPENVAQPKVSDPGSSASTSSKTSVAFEIRDDFITGSPVIVDNVNKVKTASRTSSYNFLTKESPVTINSGVSSTSTSNRGGGTRKDNAHIVNNNEDTGSNSSESLEWSGQRLVRASDFTDIPQNDSVSDWTDKHLMDPDEDSLVRIDDLTDSDSEDVTLDLTKVSDAKTTQINIKNSKDSATENKDNAIKITTSSDMSNSPTSSSGEATPPYSANGQELGSSPDLSLPKTPLELMSPEIDSLHKSGNYSIKLKAESECGDMDC